MTPQQSRYLMIAGGVLAVAGVGLYLLEKRKQVAPTSITNGVQPDPLGGQAGPGYPFVTGGGSGGSNSSVLCPDGTLVSDRALCPPTSGGGTGGPCGQHGQQCCQNSSCQSGLTCHLGQCLTESPNSGTQCSTKDGPCPATGSSFTCTCGNGTTKVVALTRGTGGNCNVGSTTAAVCSANCRSANACGSNYQAPMRNPHANLAAAVTPFGAAR